jgi:hypothetical protein
MAFLRPAIITEFYIQVNTNPVRSVRSGPFEWVRSFGIWLVGTWPVGIWPVGIWLVGIWLVGICLVGKSWLVGIWPVGIWLVGICLVGIWLAGILLVGTWPPPGQFAIFILHFSICYPRLVYLLLATGPSARPPSRQGAGGVGAATDQ